jgi:uncharacterized membrane protein
MDGMNFILMMFGLFVAVMLIVIVVHYIKVAKRKQFTNPHKDHHYRNLHEREE